MRKNEATLEAYETSFFEGHARVSNQVDCVFGVFLVFLVWQTRNEIGMNWNELEGFWRFLGGNLWVPSAHALGSSSRVNLAADILMGGSPCESNKALLVVVRVVRVCVCKLVALERTIQSTCSNLVDDCKVLRVQVDTRLGTELVLSACNRQPGCHRAIGTCYDGNTGALSRMEEEKF